MAKLFANIANFYLHKARVARVEWWAGIALISLILPLGIFTYLGLSALPSSSIMGPETVVGLFMADIVILFLLCALITLKLVRLWIKHKKGRAGSKLHFRITLLFGLIAITPAVIMMVFSSLFFHFGIQSWFSNQVKTALNESLSVAQSYLEEHKQLIGRDARLMAEDLNQNRFIWEQNRHEIDELLNVISDVRGLKEVIIFNENHDILGRSSLALALEFEVVPQNAVEEANMGRVSLIPSQYNDRVRALLKLKGSPTRYLYVGRFVDPNVLRHLKESEGVVYQYNTLALTHVHFEITFVLVFVLVALLILLASIWVGLSLADRLVSPIDELMKAAEKMREGDLSVRVPETSRYDELSSLKRSFNRLASQIESQQQALLFANQELNERRRFIESVLASVSSAVISLNDEGIIKLSNLAASRFLRYNLGEYYGTKLSSLYPEFGEILKYMSDNRITDYTIQRSLQVGKRVRTFSIHVIAEQKNGKELDLQGYVVTLEDITDLIYAQKKAAWADVARQIAHEIKNPLTPIHLATERLKDKFLTQITNSKEQFEDLIETILKYVSQIRTLIDEFSNFARMPKASIKSTNIVPLINNVLTLQKQAYPQLRFVWAPPQNKVALPVDAQQFIQALTNIIKNAIEAVALVKKGEGGIIEIELLNDENTLSVLVKDNGCGLPKEMSPEQLIKPYITRGKKGTGLGLAIVQKIMDDHQGSLTLENLANGGTMITLIFQK